MFIIKLQFVIQSQKRFYNTVLGKPFAVTRIRQIIVLSAYPERLISAHFSLVFTAAGSAYDPALKSVF